MTNKIETGLAAMAGDGGYEEAYLADAIRFKMKRDQKRFWAGDNVSEYVTEEIKHKLIDEATEAFELVLDRLLLIVKLIPIVKALQDVLQKCTLTKL